MNQLTQNDEEFRKAIKSIMDTILSFHEHDIVHGDIRWANLTYDPNKKEYLIFDFENICNLCSEESCQHHMHSELDGVRNCENPFSDIQQFFHLFVYIKENNRNKFMLTNEDDKCARLSYEIKRKIDPNNFKRKAEQLFWELYDSFTKSKFLRLFFFSNKSKIF